VSKQHKNELIDRIEVEIPYLRRFARSLTRDADLADDLVQDCMVRALGNLQSWQPGTNLRAWLITILRNKFFNDCRKAKRERMALAEHSLSEAQFMPAHQEVGLQLAAFDAAFGKLSCEHREVLMLIAVEGFRYEEAAEITGLSIGTVKSRVSRARAMLRELALQDEGTKQQKTC